MFDAPATSVAVMAYDYTVFAGTQGVHNHWRTDRILDIAEDGTHALGAVCGRWRRSARDDDYCGFIQFDTFHHFGQLSALVPLIGIVSATRRLGKPTRPQWALTHCCVLVASAPTSVPGIYSRGWPFFWRGRGPIYQDRRTIDHCLAAHPKEINQA
jgi:hypothetical protein